MKELISFPFVQVLMRLLTITNNKYNEKNLISVDYSSLFLLSCFR